ncbi:decaprenyl-phosphate phosphoribosyltransferase [Methanophagales archaeon]|nr:MAG: decaprenyl-phosphate phosphoribosyltransferase [Methanophagales archaeon]
MIHGMLISLRPEQWYKNLLIFVGIVFSLNLLNIQMWFSVIFAFVIFCMLSGSEYIINDIVDVEKDRRHPVKRKRPIASGELKISHAFVFSLVLIVIALFGAYLVNLKFFCISILFLLLTSLYTLWLKHIILIDILTISTDFVIRAIAGCVAIDIFASPWLIICVFLLALFLALGKRRYELVLLGEEAKQHRKILADYSTEMLDQMISITTGALIMSYSLYTFLADNNYMMLTIPFVIYGLFRYLFLVHARNFGGETEMIFKDKGMVLSMILWAVLVVLILYGVPDVVVRIVGGV